MNIQYVIEEVIEGGGFFSKETNYSNEQPI